MGLRLKTEEKAALFDTMFMNEYDELIELDVLSSTCRTLYACERVWQGIIGLKYDYDTTIQRYIMDVSTDADPDKILQELQLDAVEVALRKESVYRVYFSVRDESGSIQLKEAAFLHKDEDHIIMTIRDITHAFKDISGRTSRLEMALREAQHEIDEKNTFLSMMSRNIRTPLYSIMGLTRMAHEDFGENQSLEAYLRKISMSGSYMTDAIDDILELWKIARKEIEIKSRTVNLEELLLEVKRSIQDGLYERGLIFRLSAPSVKNVHIETDNNALRMILTKMLRSSMLYTVKGGRLTLSVRELFKDPTEITMEFSVESHGIVIEPDRMSYLFYPYKILREKIESGMDALDIDLVILRTYAQALEAKNLAATSDERNGTRISLTITFPLSVDEYEIKPGEKDSIENVESSGSLLDKQAFGSGDSVEHDFSGKRALLVDDNEINLEIGNKILKDKGVIVTMVTSGEDALRCMDNENGAYDIVLLDILMPGMDGLEVARRIRRGHYPNAQTLPIIAMTANAFRENYEESTYAGMNAHLVKPIDPEQLYSIMDKLLNKRV